MMDQGRAGLTSTWIRAARGEPLHARILRCASSRLACMSISISIVTTAVPITTAIT